MLSTGIGLRDLLQGTVFGLLTVEEVACSTWTNFLVQCPESVLYASHLYSFPPQIDDQTGRVVSQMELACLGKIPLAGCQVSHIHFSAPDPPAYTEEQLEL